MSSASEKHDRNARRCAVCRECIDCNLRPCRGGGPHIAAEDWDKNPSFSVGDGRAAMGPDQKMTGFGSGQERPAWLNEEIVAGVHRGQWCPLCETPRALYWKTTDQSDKTLICTRGHEFQAGQVI